MICINFEQNGLSQDYQPINDKLCLSYANKIYFYQLTIFTETVVVLLDQWKYCTQDIITHGLYIFIPFFTAVSVKDILCTKQANSSIFESKIRDL